MRRFELGVQLHPQHTTITDLRAAWQRADEMGVDSIWTWDHFFPLSGDAAGDHFEGWSLMAAKAVDTSRARIGTAVTCVAYRNPNLLADMARTVDHLSGGRVVLGVGAGWFERDFEEYGFAFDPPAERLRTLERTLRVVRERLGKLNPAPIGPMPIMVGGGGEQVTLRLVAEHADWWNGFGDPDAFARKNRVLDEWCERVGRDPDTLVRTALVGDPGQVEDVVAEGAQHVIVQRPHPYDLEPIASLLVAADG